MMYHPYTERSAKRLHFHQSERQRVTEPNKLNFIYRIIGENISLCGWEGSYSDTQQANTSMSGEYGTLVSV